MHHYVATLVYSLPRITSHTMMFVFFHDMFTIISISLQFTDSLMDYFFASISDFRSKENIDFLIIYDIFFLLFLARPGTIYNFST